MKGSSCWHRAYRKAKTEEADGSNCMKEEIGVALSLSSWR